MGWEVLTHTLHSTDSEKAQDDLQKGVDALINGIQAGLQGLAVYYGGYGLQKDTGEPYPLA